MNDQKFIDAMRKSGQLLREVLDQVIAKTGPDTNGQELDTFAESLIRAAGAVPAFKNYHEFPASLCVSVNDEVVHGIPTKRQLKVGDVVGLDLGLSLDGAFTDTARTVIITKTGVLTVKDIEQIPERERSTSEKLVLHTYRSLLKGLEQACKDNHTGDIGHAVQSYAEHLGYGVVRQLVGHGVGHAVHEEPSIPNFGKRGEGAVLTKNQAVAIEPMITVGDWRIITDPDSWTVRTRDGSLAAHFEHTVLVGDGPCEILT